MARFQDLYVWELEQLRDSILETKLKCDDDSRDCRLKLLDEIVPIIKAKIIADPDLADHPDNNTN